MAIWFLRENVPDTFNYPHTRASGVGVLRQDFWILSALAILALVPASVFATSEAPVSEQPSDMKNEPTGFEREAISSIREITLQLMLIAVGVYALVGGFASSKTRCYRHKWMIWVSFVLLALSVVCGLFVYGSLIFDLSSGRFSAGDTVRLMAMGQWVAFGLGAPFLTLFLLTNIN